MLPFFGLLPRNGSFLMAKIWQKPDKKERFSILKKFKNFFYFF